MKITFPIKEAYPSENYALIILDANNIYHYWNFDGSYDGYSHDPYIDCETGINKN